MVTTAEARSQLTATRASLTQQEQNVSSLTSNLTRQQLMKATPLSQIKQKLALSSFKTKALEGIKSIRRDVVQPFETTLLAAEQSEAKANIINIGGQNFNRKDVELAYAKIENIAKGQRVVWYGDDNALRAYKAILKENKSLLRAVQEGTRARMDAVAGGFGDQIKMIVNGKEVTRTINPNVKAMQEDLARAAISLKSANPDLNLSTSQIMNRISYKFDPDKVSEFESTYDMSRGAPTSADLNKLRYDRNILTVGPKISQSQGTLTITDIPAVQVDAPQTQQQTKWKKLQGELISRFQPKLVDLPGTKADITVGEAVRNFPKIPIAMPYVDPSGIFKTDKDTIGNKYVGFEFDNTIGSVTKDFIKAAPDLPAIKFSEPTVNMFKYGRVLLAEGVQDIRYFATLDAGKKQQIGESAYYLEQERFRLGKEIEAGVIKNRGRKGFAIPGYELTTAKDLVVSGLVGTFKAGEFALKTPLPGSKYTGAKTIGDLPVFQLSKAGVKGLLIPGIAVAEGWTGIFSKGAGVLGNKEKEKTWGETSKSYGDLRRQTTTEYFASSPYETRTLTATGARVVEGFETAGSSIAEGFTIKGHPTVGAIVGGAVKISPWIASAGLYGAAQLGKATEDIKNIDTKWSEVKQQQIKELTNYYKENPATEGYTNPTRQQIIDEINKGEEAFKTQTRTAAQIRGGIGTIFAVSGAVSTIGEGVKWLKQPKIYSETLHPKQPTGGYQTPLISVRGPVGLEVKHLQTGLGGTQTRLLYDVRGVSIFPQVGRKTILTTNWGFLSKTGFSTPGKFYGYNVKNIYSGIYSASTKQGYQKALALLTKPINKGGVYGLSTVKAKAMLKYSAPSNIQRTFTGTGVRLSGSEIKTQLYLKNVKVIQTNLKGGGIKMSRITKGESVGREGATYTTRLLKRKFEGVDWLKVDEHGKLIKELPIIKGKTLSKEFVTTKLRGKLSSKTIMDINQQRGWVSIERYPKSEVYTARTIARQLKPILKRYKQFSQGTVIVEIPKKSIPTINYDPLFTVSKKGGFTGGVKKTIKETIGPSIDPVPYTKRWLSDKGGELFPQVKRTFIEPQLIIKSSTKLSSEVGGGALPYLTPKVIQPVSLVAKSIPTSNTGALITSSVGLLDYDVDSKLKTGFNLYSKQVQELDVTEDVVKNAPGLGVWNSSAQDVAQKVVEVPKLEVAQVVTQVPVVTLGTPTISRLASPPTQPSLRTPVKIIPIIEPKKIIRRKRIEDTGDKFFTPVVRRYGKWIPYGKPIAKKKAIMKGISILRGTLGASLKIVGKKSKKPIMFAKETKEFRYGKKGPTILVQRKGKRLSTFGERLEIIRAKKGFKFI